MSDHEQDPDATLIPVPSYINDNALPSSSTTFSFGAYSLPGGRQPRRKFIDPSLAPPTPIPAHIQRHISQLQPPSTSYLSTTTSTTVNYHLDDDGDIQMLGPQGPFSLGQDTQDDESVDSVMDPSPSPLSPPLLPPSNLRTPSPIMLEIRPAPHNEPDRRVLNVLHCMTENNIAFGELILTVLDRDSYPEYTEWQNGFYRKDSRFFVGILACLWKFGRDRFQEWVLPLAIDLVMVLVNDEFARTQPLLYMTTAQLTSEFLADWTIKEMFGKGLDAAKLMPTWFRLLESATARSEHGNNTNRNIGVGFNVVTAQVFHLRSLACTKLQYIVGIFAWATGSSRRMIECLSHCSLSISFPTVLSSVAALASHALEKARTFSEGPHMFSYDNINIKSSIHVEQRPDAMNKVQSGTFPLLYSLYNVKSRSHLLLAPMMERLKAATDLSMDEFMPTRAQRKSYMKQTAVTIVRTLLAYISQFDQSANYESNPLLQYDARRPLPVGTITSFYPLRVTTVEEASTEGNILLQDEVYLRQLRREALFLSLHIIPSINDQLTNSRIRSAQLLRARDMTPWTRREIFQLGIGLFHLMMNFAWCLLHKHSFTPSQEGSLRYYFTLLEKRRLDNEKPNYYALVSALDQIRDGLLLDAWRRKSGFHDLADYAATKSPSIETLLEHAAEIILEYASPLPAAETAGTTHTNSHDATHDPVNQNTRLLLRDLLYFRELVLAVSSGDFGRVEDILPDLACIFRGAGSNNYSTEILHLFFNLKKVWTPEFADIMRDNHIISISGLPDHRMPVDLNTEHLIGYLKQLFSAKGIHSTWDGLGNVSAAINDLQSIKKKFSAMLETDTKQSTQTDTDTKPLAWRVADKLWETGSQAFSHARNTQGAPVAALDLYNEGKKKLKSSSLSTFNAKMHDIINANGLFEAAEEEEDNLDHMEFDLSRHNDSDSD